MGRLRKLRIEATKSAHKVLLGDKTGLKPAKTDDPIQETEDLGNLQEFYDLIEANRPNNETEEESDDEEEFELDYCDKCMQMKNFKDGVCQKCKKEKIEEGEVSGEEVKCSDVEDCKHHPFALSDGTNSGLMEDDFVYYDGDLYFIADVKDTQFADQEPIKDAVELFGREKGNRKYISYEDFKKYATTRGKQGSDSAWWIGIGQESDWGNESDRQYTNLYLSRAGIRHLNWYLDEKSTMNEERNRMNHLLNYDVAKTREENMNETLDFENMSGKDRGAGVGSQSVSLGDKTIDRDSIQIDGINRRDHPDFADAYISYAEFTDGTELTDDERIRLTNAEGDLINQLAIDTL